MEIINVGSVSLVVLIGIVVQAIKGLKVPSRFLPAVSLAVGASLSVAGFYANGSSPDLYSAIIVGIVSGAVSMGGYDLINRSVLNK